MRKVFIITGANRGLGKAFVDALMQQEDHLVVSISRSLSREQKEYPADRFLFVRMDLSDEDVVAQMDNLKNRIQGHIIYFINNASVIVPIAKIGDLEKEGIDISLAVNIRSTVYITRHLLRHFGENQLTFVNISSGAADRPVHSWSLYCSSKAYIQMFFKVAEMEYKAHRFFQINPGVMDTGMQDKIRESDFPEVKDFQNLEREGKLRTPKVVALEILRTIA